MGREIAIARSVNKVTSYIEKYVKLAGAEEKEEVLLLFDRMHQLFPGWVLATCPVMHPNIRFMTKNAAAVFGYSNEYLLEHAAPDKYFHLVHDADKEDLFECYSFMNEYLESLSPEEHQEYRSIFHYRMRRPNGQYMYVQDEKATINLNGNGNLYYALLRDISNERTFNGVKMELIKNDPSYFKIKEFKPSAERNLLSKREGELVMLIRQGLSTKEIAGQLKISHNTVRNIKSRLFEKFNVNNTVELLNMTA
jgi:DNA-binding CsgD family transcriptional regulator